MCVWPHKYPRTWTRPLDEMAASMSFIEALLIHGSLGVR